MVIQDINELSRIVNLVNEYIERMAVAPKIQILPIDHMGFIDIQLFASLKINAVYSFFVDVVIMGRSFIAKLDLGVFPTFRNFSVDSTHSDRADNLVSFLKKLAWAVENLIEWSFQVALKFQFAFNGQGSGVF